MNENTRLGSHLSRFWPYARKQKTHRRSRRSLERVDTLMDTIANVRGCPQSGPRQLLNWMASGKLVKLKLLLRQSCRANGRRQHRESCSRQGLLCISGDKRLHHTWRVIFFCADSSDPRIFWWGGGSSSSRLNCQRNLGHGPCHNGAPGIQPHRRHYRKTRSGRSCWSFSNVCFRGERQAMAPWLLAMPYPLPSRGCRRGSPLAEATSVAGRRRQQTRPPRRTGSASDNSASSTVQNGWG